jgi:hypothetical protein
VVIINIKINIQNAETETPDSMPSLGLQKKDKICLVCGDKALGYNFNAVSCAYKFHIGVDWVWVMVLNATFNNISAISGSQFYWRRKPEYPEKTTDRP